jgi:hypothetical protein
MGGRHCSSCGMHSSGVALKKVGNGYGGAFFGLYISGPRGTRCAKDADLGGILIAANLRSVSAGQRIPKHCSHL